MKKTRCTGAAKRKKGLLLLLLTLLFAYAGKTSAQQTIFEMPSSQITAEKNFFVQQQIIIKKAGAESNSIAVYGLGLGFEAGVTVAHVQLYRPAAPAETPAAAASQPDVLINAQKAIHLNEQIHLGWGTRSGANIAPAARSWSLATFNYLNGHYALKGANNFIVLGGYYTNQAYAGPGTEMGAMIGVQHVLIKEKLFAMADFVSGNNDIAGLSAGLQLNVGAWALAMGGRLGKGLREPGGIVQLSWK